MNDVISSQIPRKPLPELIKKAREVNNLTQAAFGKLFSPPVAQPTVARWEKGEQLPDRKHFPKIASLLNFTLEELFEFVEGPLVDGSSLPVVPNINVHTPNKQHLAMLNRGVVVWNRWREKNPEVIPELAGAEPLKQDLEGINLSGADLRGIKFYLTDLSNANLAGTDLRKARLTSVSLSNADLRGADFSEANLSSSYFVAANLNGTSFSEAILRDTNFHQANLTGANFSNADLTGADLRCAVLNSTNFENAVLKYCLVYGVSAWDIKLKGAVQEKLNICQYNVKYIYVDDLRSAFIKSIEIAHLEDGDEVQKAASWLQKALENQKKPFRDNVNQTNNTLGGKDET